MNSELAMLTWRLKRSRIVIPINPLTCFRFDKNYGKKEISSFFSFLIKKESGAKISPRIRGASLGKLIDLIDRGYSETPQCQHLLQSTTFRATADMT